jgi:5-methylcytosine-specific restriction endonuclease McrA
MGDMAISAHTRKILWSFSGNACARCGTQLVTTPVAADDRHAIVGRECHIVAQAPSGPRGMSGPRQDLDDYENLILLCANCHAVVDWQPAQFPPEKLRELNTPQRNERRNPEQGEE